MEILNKLKELHITSDGYYGTYITYVIYDHKTRHYFTEKEDIEEILNDLVEELEKRGEK